MVSIIIPTFNSEETIANLLDSILSSDLREESEIIVVDDASNDRTVELVKHYPVKLIINDKKQGSAKARNLGVSNAKGEKIIFFDSDIVINPDTLSKLIKSFKSVSEQGTLIGIYAIQPLNKGFAPEYKALLDYNHWRQVDSNRVTSFEPRCAIIRKETFVEFGGFNEKIKGADVEDYEFGYRLLKKYNIYLDKSIQVQHRFPSKMSNIIINFLQRGSSWTELFLKRKKFDNVGTTPKAAISCGSAFLSFLSLGASYFHNIYLLSTLLFLFLYLYFYKDFFVLVYREKRLLFTLKAITFQYILSIILILAAGHGFFTYILKPKEERL